MARRYPTTLPEALKWLFVALGVLLLAVVAIYAVNALAALGVTLLFLVVVGLFLWVVVGRLWDTVRHGKPLKRGDWDLGRDNNGGN